MKNKTLITHLMMEILQCCGRKIIIILSYHLVYLLHSLKWIFIKQVFIFHQALIDLNFQKNLHSKQKLP